MVRHGSDGFEEYGRWLALAGAAIAAGLLPKTWQKTVTIAGAVLVVLKTLDR